MTKIVVEALPEPIYAGDWHDKPLRWTVKGPGNEVQNFSTKTWANKYKCIRRKSVTKHVAMNEFVRQEF